MLLSLSMASSTKPSAATPPSHGSALWRSRLGSGLRTAASCVLVGCATLYAPADIRRYLDFPALSYVVATIVAADSTLADSLSGACCAMYGTALAAPPAFLALRLVGPAGFSALATALAVALTTFAVALPNSVGLLTKRMALAHTVIAYGAACYRAGREGGSMDFWMIPAHVAACTGVGAAAAVLAVALPYPRLSSREVRKKSNLYANISLERLRLLVDAFCADDKNQMDASFSQAKSLTTSCAKLLQNIKLKQVNIVWETPIKFLQAQVKFPLHRLQAIKVPLEGMEIALAAHSLNTHQQLKDNVSNLRHNIALKLNQEDHKIVGDMVDTTPQSLQVIPQDLQDLPSFFFLFCMELLYNGQMATPTNKLKPITPVSPEQCNGNGKKSRSPWAIGWKPERLVMALKWSLSVGLAMLLGLFYSKENGFWSGIIVAFSVVPSTDSTLKLANIRAHGTALGTVYGVLGTLVSQNLMQVRLSLLVPWIIFTTFLWRSRMFGQAGGMAAAISAIFVLGRKNYGSPTMFAIARITETIIGLTSSIGVDLLLQPKRASSLARSRLTQSLERLTSCVELVGVKGSLVQLEENAKQLRQEVNELVKYIVESENEPNLWLLPLHVDCYKRLHCSLSMVVELVHFLVQAMHQLVDASHVLGNGWCESHESINGDLEHFRKAVGSSVRCYKEVLQVKSLARLEKDLERKRASIDLETGNAMCQCECLALDDDKEKCDRAMACFIEHSRDLVEKLDADIDFKGHLVLSLAAIGFCMEGLKREVTEMDKLILELVQWENPSRKINLYDISRKISELSS